MISPSNGLSASGGSRIRPIGMAFLVIMVMGALLLPPAQAAPSLDSEELAFCQLINNYRAQYGLPPLQASTPLNSAADWFSTDMATKNYSSSNHIDSQGRGPAERMLDFGYPANSTQTGENIAGGNSTASATFDQWRSSPSHDRNMRDPNFKVIGIGRAFDSASVYEWYWTTDFGGFIDSSATPCSSSTSPTPAPTTPSPATPTLEATTPSTATPTPEATTPSTATPTPEATTPSTVTPTPEAATPFLTPTVSASPAANAGGLLRVTWSGLINPTPNDWIGLYPFSGTPHYGDIAWRYTDGGASGTVSIRVPPGTPPGTGYEIRLFRNDTYRRLATSGPLRIVRATVSANPTTTNAGGVLRVSWSGLINPTPNDWIGLYPSLRTPYYGDIAWRYTDGGASGTVSIRVPPGAPPGTSYEVRLFRNDTYSRLATSGPLTVN